MLPGKVLNPPVLLVGRRYGPEDTSDENSKKLMESWEAELKTPTKKEELYEAARQDGRICKFMHCRVVRYFISGCLLFLDRYARANADNQEEVRNLIMNETTRSKLGPKAPMTKFLIEVSNPDKIAEGHNVATLMSAIYRNSRRALGTPCPVL